MNSQSPRSSAGARALVDTVLRPMKARFVGKDEIVDLIGIALVAGENLFLYGPPGTAKSAIVQDLGRRIGGRTFDYLLTRFTEPSELFGPFDIRKLRDGDLVTNTEGMLPEADLVFFDELLNANSAILNSLLTVLNERVFRRGRETRQLPLLSAFGASNHLPEDDALRALFDRFLIRVVCDVVPGERLSEVLVAGWDLERNETPESDFHIDDLQRLRASVRDVDLSATRDDHVGLVLDLRRAGIDVSDRRAVKLQRLVAASALLSGRSASEKSDLWVFRTIWDSLEQREIIASIVEERIRDATSSPTAHPRASERGQPDPDRLDEELTALEQSLDATPSSAELAAIRDRASAVASRVAWIDSDTARSALDSRLASVWKRLDDA